MKTWSECVPPWGQAEQEEKVNKSEHLGGGAPQPHSLGTLACLLACLLARGMGFLRSPGPEALGTLLRQGIGGGLSHPATRAPHLLWGFEEA